MTIKELFKDLDSYGSQIPLDDICNKLFDLDAATIPLDKWAKFGDQSYQRISVHLGRCYEAMLLCWRPGQASPIHDHQGSNCGVKVITGTMSEWRYMNGAPLFPGVAFSPFNPDRYKTGEIIGSESEDIHRIWNNEENELITLHIYSPPLFAMNIYYESADEAISSFDPMI